MANINIKFFPTTGNLSNDGDIIFLSARDFAFNLKISIEVTTNLYKECIQNPTKNQEVYGS